MFGMTLQFLALEYLLLFPALLYFCIDLYTSLSAISLSGTLISLIILGVRCFVFTAVCARSAGRLVSWSVAANNKEVFLRKNNTFLILRKCTVLEVSMAP